MRRINLMPAEAKKITPKKWLKDYLFKSPVRRLITSGVIIFIFVNLWQVSSFLRYKFAIIQGEKNLAKLQENLIQTQQIYSQIKNQRQEIDKEIGRIEEKFRTLQQQKQEMLAWAQILTEISELLPEDLWINKIRLNKELVTLSGATFDNVIVSDFMAKIDESNYFQETSFNYTQKSKLQEKPVINFEITTLIDWEKVPK